MLGLICIVGRTYMAEQPPADNDCEIQVKEQVVIPLGRPAGALVADWAFAPRMEVARTTTATNLLNMFILVN